MAGIFNSAIFNNAIFNVGTITVPATLGAGSLDWLRRGKKKRVRIRFGDYTSQEERAAALAAAAIPLSRITESGVVEGDSEIDDDDEILRALFLIKTIQ